MTIFEAQYQVQWSDCDANNHFKNTAFLDYAAQTRFLYFESKDFPPAAFVQHGIGPVVLEDCVTYRRELRLLERFSVQFLMAGMNADGSRFHIVNRIFKSDGELAAEVKSKGLWLDLQSRSPVPPPDKLLQAMRNVAPVEGYADLP